VDVDSIAYISEVHDGTLKMEVPFTSKCWCQCPYSDGATTQHSSTQHKTTQYNTAQLNTTEEKY
jgi:hypothetical protein